MALTLKMLYCWGIIVILSIGGIQATKEEKEEREYVMMLDHSNFTDVVSMHDLIVVEFYAPWCGHCQKFAPEYEKAAARLSKREPAVTLAKVDAAEEANRELAMDYNIQGIPAVKIIRNNGQIVYEYKGPREADAIVNFVIKQLGPPSTEIKSIEDAAPLIDGKKISIVGVFPEYSGEKFENFTKLAETLRSEYEFSHTLDANLLPRGDTSINGPLIRLFKPFDELFLDFQDFEIEAMEKFIEEATVPSVTIFDNDPTNQPYIMKYFNKDHNAKAMLFLNFSTANFEAFKAKFHDLAVLFKDKGIGFMMGDLESSEGALQYYKLEASETPVILIQRGEEKYVKTNLEVDQVVPWFKQYVDEKLVPFKKSQPIPESNDEPVKVVVLDTLQDMVFNSGKHVLLEFYAPWCGHCKKLAPVLEEVAISYENDPNVLIAKFDGTANDIPSETFEVQGFPTLYFISSVGKVVPFDGDRTKEAIIEFIEKNRRGGVSTEENSATDDDEDDDDDDLVKDEL